MADKTRRGWLDITPGAARGLLIVGLLITAMGITEYMAWQRVSNLAECNRAYVAAAARSVNLYRDVQLAVATADDRIWRNVQIVFTQNAGPADYKRLREAVQDRNTLRQDQARRIDAHPLPATPAVFCEGSG